ncbi:hypothetical protein BZA77DRAFT_385354 [Pyronema omphalodes]|nr:hypothetical protein BZA77DRAFT_385354 [Pyronema omphalodes]
MLSYCSSQSVPDRDLSEDGRRASLYFQLNSPRLPPSPQSLDSRAHQQAASLELSYALRFTHSDSRSSSEEPLSWHLTPASSSLEGSESYRRHNTHTSLYLTSEISSSDYNSTLMASSGLETPPGSARSSSIDLDRQAHSYAHPTGSLPGEYLTHNDNMYQLSHDQRHNAARDMAYASYGGSPTNSPNSRYLYAPYNLDTRPPPLPLPYEHRTELPSLPWPPTAPPRRYVDPIPQLSGHQESWNDDRQAESGYRCSSARCRYTASSPEQLTKHRQKHLKIHYCRFSPCPRTEGFATPNDRERHEKSIHKIPGFYWKCLDSNCGSYGKEFSRRDNLKDHLKRMHPVPDGISDSEASAMRSRLADTWRFDKGGRT